VSVKDAIRPMWPRAETQLLERRTGWYARAVRYPRTAAVGESLSITVEDAISAEQAVSMLRAAVEASK